MSELRRFVLFHASGEPSPEALALLDASPGVKIIDRTQTRAMLVQASLETIDLLSRELVGWTIAEERFHAGPGPAMPAQTRDLGPTRS
ncbi:MAG: hypothetical protein R3F15_09995 [Lysobacterales bacterium]